MTEEAVEAPYVKDYDAYEDESPRRWLRFDVSRWLFLMAFDGDEPVGGAMVAYRSPKVNMLDGRDDLAVLWDFRVATEHRGRGIGKGLFDRAAQWARERGCAQLKVETQNVNVRACRFYAGRGCRLGAIHRYGYREPEISHEMMLLWYLDL